MASPETIPGPCVRHTGGSPETMPGESVAFASQPTQVKPDYQWRTTCVSVGSYSECFSCCAFLLILSFFQSRHLTVLLLMQQTVHTMTLETKPR